MLKKIKQQINMKKYDTFKDFRDVPINKQALIIDKKGRN